MSKRCDRLFLIAGEALYREGPLYVRFLRGEMDLEILWVESKSSLFFIYIQGKTTL